MKYYPSILAILFPLIAPAQAAGDELFDTDQVIDIQLTFAQPAFWDSLTAYYAEGLERDLLGSVTITDLMGTYTYDSVGVRLKGNSSYGVQGVKKSMKIDFNAYVSGQKYHGLKKINLNNGFNDPTFLREKIFFDFSHEQGVLAPRAVFSDLRINGTLWGFYGVVEQIDKTFLARWLGDNDGNMFKAGDQFGSGGGNTAADLAYYGSAQSGYTDRYELKTNEDVDDWSDLIALLQLLSTLNNDDLRAKFPSQWDWEAMLRSLAMDNLFSNLDGYINSARNYYVYHDITTSKWNWIKWDANESFGRYGNQAGNLLTLSPYYIAPGRPLMTKIMGIPAFREDYLAEYCAAFGGFTNQLLDPRIDVLATLIQPHVLADPNKQYSNAQFTSNLANDVTVNGGPGGSQTIYGLKSFIASRRSSLTGQLNCEQVGMIDLMPALELTIAPNPCRDFITISPNSTGASRTATVTNAIGQVQPVTISGNMIDVSVLTSGSYVLSVAVPDGHVFRSRFVKD